MTENKIPGVGDDVQLASPYSQLRILDRDPKKDRVIPNGRRGRVTGMAGGGAMEVRFEGEQKTTVPIHWLKPLSGVR